jgi:hypothetical protein
LYDLLIELARELGAPNLMNVHCGKNATYKSWDTAQSLLQQLSSEVNATVHAEVDSSSHFSLLCDEVTDVASRKHLAILCRYLDINK